MSEPYKIKFDYKHPENIDAEVPREQKLRDNDGVVPNEEDGTFVPIMTVTKEEAAYTKGDLKLQKISVTENISEQKNGGMYIVINPFFSAITGEVIDGPQQLRQMNGSKEKRQDCTKEDKIQAEEKRTRTKIPMLKFKQTVEKVKNQRKGSEEVENEEPPPQISQKRRSSIPRLKGRISRSAVKDSVNQSDENNVNKDVNDNNNNQNNFNDEKTVKKHIEGIVNKEGNNTNKDSAVNDRQDPQANNQTSVDSKPEDEFEKIYEQIIDTEQKEVVICENVLIDSIDDPEKLETSFEEIIHAYEEKPAVISKIPLLKQKSLHDVKLPVKTERRLSLKNEAPFSVGNIKINNNLQLKGDLRPSENKAEITKNNVTQIKKDSEFIEVKNDDTHMKVEEKPTQQHFKETVKVATPVFENIDKSNNVEKYHKQPEVVPNIDNSSKITDSLKMVRNIQATTQANVTTDFRINERTKDLPKGNDDNELHRKEKTVLRENVTQIINKLDKKVDVNDGENEFCYTPKKSVSEVGHAVDSKKQSVGVNPEKYKLDINKKYDQKVDQFTEKENRIEKVPVIEKNKQEKQINEIKYLPAKSDSLLTIDKVTKIECKNSEKTTEKDIIEDENIPCLKGKVSKIINRLVSNDGMETTNKKEFIEPVPIKKSVSSRIAMFERQVSETIPPPPKPLIETKIPKPKHKELLKPKIIDEILKSHKNEHSVTNAAKEEITESKDFMRYEENLKFINGRESGLSNLNDNKAQMAREENTKIISEIYNETDNVKENLETKMAYEENLKVISDIENELNNIKEDIFVSKEQIEANEIKGTITNENNNPSPNSSTHVNEEKTELYQEIIETKKEEIKIDNKAKHEMKPIKVAKVIESGFKPQGNKVLKKLQSHEDRKAPWAVDDKEQRNELKKSTDSSTDKKYGAFMKTATTPTIEDRLKRMISHNEETMRRSKSVAELDLGDAVKGKVHKMIVRINSVEKIEVERKEINLKERPRRRTVSEKIALFEKKLIPVQMEETTEKAPKIDTKPKVKASEQNIISDEAYREKIAELTNAKLKYGRINDMIYLKLRNGIDMPVLAVGTALLESRLIRHVIGAAIDLGYRAIDTAFIYGNEKEVGEAIKAKIDDGTVKREDLFIISKLWSTFHRQDLVETACRSSLEAMGLEYFDLYLIHNPMSFQEGADPIPKIANVIQFSTSDYLDAWYGMEELINKGLVKSIGVSNFNSEQIARVTERARVKPAVNQVECHPYLTQQRLEQFCAERDVKLCCFGVLGSKGTPEEYKSNLTPVIDDPLIKCMAAGLQITPAQLLIRYQIESGHSAVVKCSSAAHLWDNLQSLTVTLSQTQVDALHALNANKRTHAFKGLGDTHKNYPFKIPF